MDNRKLIDSLLSGNNGSKEVDEAYKEIQLIQEGSQFMRTGVDHLDYFLIDGLMGKFVFIGARPSQGKCLAKGTKVIMFDGTKKEVEKIEKDDLLMGIDSKPRKVLSLAYGKEQMYWVRQNKGLDYRVNESHILSLRKGREEGLHSKGHIENVSILDYLKWNDKKKSSYKGYNLGWELPEKSTSIPPYILGLWLGDGETNSQKISNNDIEVITELKKYAKKIGREFTQYKDKRSKNIVNNITDKSSNSINLFKSKLLEESVLGNKHIPKNYLLNSRKNRLELLAGIIDTDGYLGFENYEVIQKSERLVKDIQALACSLGFKCIITNKIGKIKSVNFEGNYFRIRIIGNTWEIPCRVTRKANNFKKLKRNPNNTGIKLEKDIIDEYYGFTIDGDNLFLLEDGTVTHNTHLGSKIIRNILDKELNKGEYSVLRFNWEMATKSLLLRSLKEKLKKTMRSILNSPFTEEEKPAVDEVLFEYTHPKIRNISHIFEGNDLRYLLDNFCNSVPPSTKKIIVIDHIHILPNKTRIDDFLTILNEYKMKYPNLGFIIFFQLNRELETIWRGGKDSKANPKNFRPNSSHIYNTDMLFQLADIIMTLVIPQVVNLDKYAAINSEYHPNLDEHYIDDEGDTTWVRLEGRNRIYYDYIKIRMADDFEDPRLYCDILNSDREIKIQAEGTDIEVLANVPAFMKTPVEGVKHDKGGIVNPKVPEDIILGNDEEGDDLPF